MTAAIMTNLRTYGKPPYRIAVIHGGPGAAGEMAPVARALSLEMGVLEPYQMADSIDAQVAELAAVLREHGQPPVTLIGFSWGAWLSLITAARHPDLIGKLILVGCPPFEERHATGIMKIRLARLDPPAREEVERLRTSLDDPSIVDKDILMCRLGEILARADTFDPLPFEDEAIACQWHIFDKVWSEALRLRRNGELLERTKAVVCPVVAIHGDCDPHPAAGVGEPLERVLKDFRLILLERCGHQPWREKWAREEFFHLLRTETR